MSGNIFTETDPINDSCRLYEAGEVQQYLDELTRLKAENERLTEAQNLDVMATRVISMCKKRGWSLHWTHRGAYLHLESSELIEAIRGKHGDPEQEAGDVLLVLLSIVEYAGIPFSNVIKTAEKKLTYLETAPPYPGEERTALNNES